jgi:hypothetical protein
MATDRENLEERIAGNIESALERLLAPIVHVERLKRREYLTPEEVEAVYGLKAVTLANKRSKAQGPEYIKDGDKILYRQQAILPGAYILEQSQHNSFLETLRSLG